MNRLAKYRQQLAATIASMKTALEAADANPNGKLTADQETAYTAFKATKAELEASITREVELAAAEASAVAVTTVAATVTEAGTNGKPFRTLGENLLAIVQVGTPTLPGNVREEAHNRLMAAASGAGANVGTDGGFLIQKDFAPELVRDAFQTGILSSQCSVHEVSANSDGLEVPYINETSRATGSRWGGVQVYRRAEADTVTSKKPQLGLWEVRLEDLMGLAYLTERLMTDAPAMAGVFQEAFIDEFAFKLDDEIFRGSGVGECLGILNAPVTVSQAEVTGQGASTIVADNVINMWARVLPRSKSRGSWFINCECSPQLQKMYVATGTSGQLIYMPPGGLTGSSNATLFGRPVVEIEQAAGLGTVGDIVFLDLSQYKLVRKAGITADESIHVRFIYGERTLRWMVRVNGAPKLKSPIRPYKGTGTLSSLVTLATRA